MNRRGFLKRLAVAAGVTAAGVALPTEEIMAALAPVEPERKIFPVAKVPSSDDLLNQKIKHEMRAYEEWARYLNPVETPYVGHLIQAGEEIMYVKKVEWGMGPYPVLDVVRGFGGTTTASTSSGWTKSYNPGTMVVLGPGKGSDA